MAKRTPTAATTPALPTQTEEENAAFQLRWRVAAIRALKDDAQRDFEKAQADLAADIARAYDLSWSLAPTYVVAREVYGLASSWLEVAAMTDEEVMARGREARDAFAERMISNHSGMDSGGDLNSTNPFSRAITAAKWSALHDLYRKLNMLIGK